MWAFFNDLRCNPSQKQVIPVICLVSCCNSLTFLDLLRRACECKCVSLAEVGPNIPARWLPLCPGTPTLENTWMDCWELDCLCISPTKIKCASRLTSQSRIFHPAAPSALHFPLYFPEWRLRLQRLSTCSHPILLLDLLETRNSTRNPRSFFIALLPVFLSLPPISPQFFFLSLLEPKIPVFFFWSFTVQRVWK